MTELTTGKTRGPPYPGWHDFVAGAVAGGGARMLTHPLDLIRTRRQLASTNYTTDAIHPKSRPRTSIWQDMVQVVQHEGGVRGLFRGNMSALSLWVSYQGVQFYAYGFTKRYFQSVYPNDSQRTLIAFCSGATAGVVATVSTYPLDLCRTIFVARGAAAVDLDPPNRVQSTVARPEFRPPQTVLEFASTLYHRRGWRGFYAGCAPTVLQIIPYIGGSFAIYDALTRGDRGVALSAYAGSIAGAISKALVYPMDTVKKRLQAQAFFGSSSSQQRPYAGIVDCVVTIYRVEGVGAFYNGFVPSVLKTSLSAGLSFAFFRSTKNLLESIHDKPFSDDDPPTRRSLKRRMTTGR